MEEVPEFPWHTIKYNDQLILLVFEEVKKIGCEQISPDVFEETMWNAIEICNSSISSWRNVLVHPFLTCFITAYRAWTGGKRPMSLNDTVLQQDPNQEHLPFDHMSNSDHDGHAEYPSESIAPQNFDKNKVHLGHDLPGSSQWIHG